MTSRHSRGGVQTVDPHDDPDRPTSAPSGPTGARHQSPTGGRHGGAPGRQPFGQFGTDADATVQVDDARPDGTTSGPGPMPAPAPSPETIARPIPETPPLGSDATRDPAPYRSASSRPTTSTSRSSVTGHRPPGTPAATPAKWPWLLLAAAALLLGVLLGRASAPSAAAVATPPPAPVTVTAAPPAAPPVPSKVTLPSVSGRNGAIVADQLRGLGLTKVQFASSDDDDKVVLDPANWTAKKIEPGVGSKVATDATVVVTMTKEN